MESMIPIFAIGSVFGTALIITIVALIVGYRTRAMQHRERLAAIEKGLPVPDLEAKEPGGRNASLKTAIILIFVGVGLAGALYVMAGLEIAVWGAFVAFIGLGHLVWWMVSGKLEKTGSAS